MAFAHPRFFHRLGHRRLAIALGYLATQAELKTRFPAAANLKPQLDTAQRQGCLKQVMQRSVSGPSLLIIDEIGYLPTSRDQANLFFQIIANRYKKGLRAYGTPTELRVGLGRYLEFYNTRCCHSALDRCALDAVYI